MLMLFFYSLSGKPYSIILFLFTFLSHDKFVLLTTVGRFHLISSAGHIKHVAGCYPANFAITELFTCLIIFNYLSFLHMRIKIITMPYPV